MWRCPCGDSNKVLRFFTIIPAKIFHLDILTEIWDNRILVEHRQHTERYERKVRIMTRVGVGQSQRTALADALEDAATIAMGNAQLAKADLAVVFATVDYQADYGQLFRTIHEVSGCDHLVGCSGMSVLTSAGEIEGEPAVAVLVLRSDDVSAIPFLVSSDDSSMIGAAIRERISPKLNENSLLVVLPDCTLR